MTPTRRRTVIVCSVAVLVAIAAALVVLRLVRDDAPTTGLAYAVTLAPDDSQRVLWTDWAGVRREVGADLGPGSSGEEVDDMLSAAFDLDLTSASALPESAVRMQADYAFSPATLDWEVFAQSDIAATLTMKLSADVSTDDVAAALRELGYTEPSAPEGVWTSTTSLPISGDVTPELSYIALDADAGVVYASDQAGGVRIAIAAADDDGASPLPEAVVADLADPVAAVLYDGAEACTSLAMANADPSEAQAGAALVAAAGEVNPLTAFGMGVAEDGTIRVTMGFDDAEQARTNADTRAVLAAGPAPGQGGDFTDRFTVEEVVAEGDVVTMRLAPVDGAFVLSDLTTGPVLFATC